MADQDPGPTTSKKSHQRSKGKKKPLKRSARVQKSVTKFTQESAWTVPEKTKLLEGVRRFSAQDVEILSSIIGTKTPEEVASAIGVLSKPKPVPKQELNQKHIVEEKSPIELWTDLVHEIVFYEPADYSEHICKVFGLIARDETFAKPPDSVPRLSWRRLYQYITDILEDKTEYQELSDVESLVMLDLLHGVGDAIHASDTTPQQRLMTAKYNMLNTKLEETSEAARIQRVTLINRAFANDFDFLKEPSKAAEPTRSEAPLEDNDMMDTSTPQTSTAMATAGTATPSASSSSTVAASSVAAAASVAETSSSSGPSLTFPSSSSASDDLGCSTSTAVTDEDSSCTSGSTAVEDGALSETCRGIKAVFSSRHDKFVKSKYITLNPLCIPTSLLSLKPRLESV